MFTGNFWLITSLSLAFIYNIALFSYASNILSNATKKYSVYILFSIINTTLTWHAVNTPEYFYLSFFAVATLLTLQFKLFSSATLRQALFGSITFSFHIASIILPILMIFSLVMNKAPLTLLEDKTIHYMILSTSIVILLAALVVVKKIIPHIDIIRISTGTPYSETHTATTAFILSYLSFDTYCLVTENLYIQQAFQIFIVTALSLGIFYYLLFYTINFINLSMYKRQSDIAQTSYNQLLIKKKEASDKLITDHLTKLYNKKFIFEQLQEYLSTPNSSFGLAFLDVNALKYVNDTYGHEVGDEYLKAIASSLKSSTRDCDLPARISGDEFLVILPDLDSEERVTYITERISAHIDQQPTIGDFKISASLGYIFITDEIRHLSMDEIIELADKNMRVNKAKFYANRTNTAEVS